MTEDKIMFNTYFVWGLNNGHAMQKTYKIHTGILLHTKVKCVASS